MTEGRKTLCTWAICVIAAGTLCLLSVRHASRSDADERVALLRRLDDSLGSREMTAAEQLEWETALEEINREQTERARTRTRSAINHNARTPDAMPESN